MFVCLDGDPGLVGGQVVFAKVTAVASDFLNKERDFSAFLWELHSATIIQDHEDSIGEESSGN